MFASIVREARVSQGLLQAEVGRRAGVSAQAVLDLEGGKGTLATLLPVLDVLDVRLAGLVAGKSLPERIKAARERRGLSREALAQRSGVSKGAVIRLERGSGRIASLEAVLAVLAPQVRVRKPERTRWAAGTRDCRYTPPDLIAAYEGIFGAFDLDPCSDPDAPFQPDRVWTKEDDGLSRPWDAHAAFVNPPYSEAAKFVRKAFEEWSAGRCSKVVLLLAVRTNGGAFHDYIAQHADTFFLRGRVSFVTPEGPLGRTPFGVMTVVFGATEGEAERFRQTFACVHLAPALGRGAVVMEQAA